MEMQQGLVLWPCKLNQLKPVEMIRVKLKITYNSNNGIPPPPPLFSLLKTQLFLVKTGILQLNYQLGQLKSNIVCFYTNILYSFWAIYICLPSQ